MTLKEKGDMMKKCVLIVSLIILCFSSVYAFTRVVNDLNLTNFTYGFGESELTIFPSNASNNNFGEHRNEFIEIIDEYDAMLSIIYVDESNINFEYYNVNSEYKKEIDKYNNICTVRCIKFKEMDTEFLSIDEGITINSADIEELETEILKLGISLGEFDDNHEEEMTSNYSVILEMLVSTYDLYVKIFILIVCVFSFTILIDAIDNLKEVRLQAMFGFKFKSFWWSINKNLLLNRYLPYITISTLLSFIIFKSPLNSVYILLITTLLIILSMIISSIILGIIYFNIARKVFHNLSGLITNVTSIMLVIISLLVIDSAIVLMNKTDVSLLFKDSNEYLSNYYHPFHETSMGAEEMSELSNYLIDSEQAIFQSVYHVVEEDDSRRDNTDYVLEVDNKFFERNPQIKLSNGEQIDYNKIYLEHYEENMISDETLEEMKNGVFVEANISDDEIRSLTLPPLIFKKEQVNVENSQLFQFVDYDSAMKIEIYDDNQEYETFNVEVENLDLNEFAIIVTGDLFPSNLYIHASSSSAATRILQEAYDELGIKQEAKVRSAGLGSIVQGSMLFVRDSIIALFIACVMLLSAVVLYIDLLFIKHTDSIMLATIHGFKKGKVFKPVIYEFAILNICILLFLVGFLYSHFTLIVLVCLMIIEYIIINIRVRNLVKSNIVSYVKGELNAD